MDIAVVSVTSYLSTMFDHFRLCLEHGANVVTIEEETVYPWRTAPELARELDAVAKANGVTLAASGAQDVFWLHLVGTLLGAAHRVERVTGHCRWNADDYGPEVAAHVHVGERAEDFDRYVVGARLARLRRPCHARGPRRPSSSSRRPTCPRASPR